MSTVPPQILKLQATSHVLLILETHFYTWHMFDVTVNCNKQLGEATIFDEQIQKKDVSINVHTVPWS